MLSSEDLDQSNCEMVKQEEVVENRMCRALFCHSKWNESRWHCELCFHLAVLSNCFLGYREQLVTVWEVNGSRLKGNWQSGKLFRSQLLTARATVSNH